MRYGVVFGSRHFNLRKQQDFIAGHGASCRLFPTVVCPCVTVELQFDPLCGVCRGTGRFPQPDLETTLTLLLTQYRARQNFHEPGSWIEGDLQATVPPGVRLTDNTLVRVLDMAIPFNDEVLWKDRIDTVRFSGNVVLGRVRDLTTLYTPGVDYALTPPNTVTWLAGGTAPDPGGAYTVSYTAQPEYLVFMDSPRARVEHRGNYAQVVQLRRLDMIQGAAR